MANSILDTVFGNDPNIPDEMEQPTHLYVAGIVAAALLFMLGVRITMKSAAM